MGNSTICMYSKVIVIFPECRKTTRGGGGVVGGREGRLLSDSTTKKKKKKDPPAVLIETRDTVTYDKSKLGITT